MAKNNLCLHFIHIIVMFLISNSYVLAQKDTLLKSATLKEYDFPYVKYSFSINHQTLHKNISIEQPLIIPEYELSFTTSQVQKSCSFIQCKNPLPHEIRLSKNQTWNGLFSTQNNLRLDKHLTDEEIAYKLSSTIRGLDPVFTNRLVKLGVLKRINLKTRPTSWSDFLRFIYKLQRETKRLGFSYDFYNEITSVHGYENAILLDYFNESRCKVTSIECEGQNLEFLKSLVSETEKTLVINYTPAKNKSDVSLYENEVDQFDIIIAKDKTNNQLISRKTHNLYEIKSSENPSNTSQIILNITPIKRNLVPLPDNFLNVLANNFAHGIFFEWKISQKLYDSSIINELNNIFLSFKICKLSLFSCKTVLEKNIRLSDLDLPEVSTNDDIMLYKLYLDKDKNRDILIDMARYKIISKIEVKGSTKIISPENNIQKQIIQFIPYDKN